MSCCRKREVGGAWTLGKMVGKEDGGRCWTSVGRSLGLGFGLGKYVWCCLNIPGIPAFALFQCFLTFQYSRLFEYICIYIYIYMFIQAQRHYLSSGYFLLVRGDVGVF
jgi:hypothetical protein